MTETSPSDPRDVKPATATADNELRLSPQTIAEQKAGQEFLKNREAGIRAESHPQAPAQPIGALGKDNPNLVPQGGAGSGVTDGAATGTSGMPAAPAQSTSTHPVNATILNSEGLEKDAMSTGTTTGVADPDAAPNPAVTATPVAPIDQTAATVTPPAETQAPVAVVPGATTPAATETTQQAPAPAAAPAPEAESDDAPEEPEGHQYSAEELSGLSLNALKGIAKPMGITGLTTKEDLTKAILDAQSKK